LGVWGLGYGPHPPNPNPQSPIPNPQSPLNILIRKKLKLINGKKYIELN
jgi:hypothetical protein